MQVTELCQTFLESGTLPEKDVLDQYTPVGIDADPLSLASGLFAFQLALTHNMAKTAQAAVEQIDICLRMAKFFQFHLRHVTEAKIEQARNAESLAVFNQVKTHTLQNAQGYLRISMQIFKELGVGTDSEQFRKLRAAGDAINQVAILAEVNRPLADTYLQLAKPDNYNIFPAQHNTEPLVTSEKITAHGIKLAQIFGVGQSKLTDAVEHSLGSMLARIKYIREVVIPAAPDVTAKWDEDIEYNMDFIRGLMGWQHVFSQISANNGAFIQSLSPRLP